MGLEKLDLKIWVHYIVEPLLADPTVPEKGVRYKEVPAI